MPKSTGQELFNEAYVERTLAHFSDIKPNDVLCTLTHFTALSISRALGDLPTTDFEIYGSGGGMFNSFLVACITHYMVKPLRNSNVIGIHPDAKEAALFALFALFAYKSMFSSPFSLGDLKPFYMGKLSFPY